MNQSKAGAGAADHPNRTYEDFEPVCKWRDNNVEVHLHGFKKEQMRVQTNAAGMLTISGERPLDKAASTWSRFHKEIKLAEEYCDINRVEAKFLAGVLTVTMPQKPINNITNDQAIAVRSTSLKALMNSKVDDDQDNNTAAANNENATLLLDESVKSRSCSELGQTNLTFKSRLRVAVVLVVLTAVVIVIGFGFRGIYTSNIRTEEAN